MEVDDNYNAASSDGKALACVCVCVCVCVCGCVCAHSIQTRGHVCMVCMSLGYFKEA